ncbi:MAG: hypothetical protein J5I47_05070, partial [Vicingus serpentipes]|nr:hypothetical protein [Vicingus serpentipes]
KYEKLFQEAKGHQDRLKELESLRDEEIAIKKEEQEEKRLEEEAKLLEQKQELLTQLELIRREDEERELFEADLKYQALYEKANKFGIDTTIIQKLHAEEKLKISKKFEEKEAKEVEEAEAKKREARALTISSFELVLDELSRLYEEGSVEQKAIAIGKIAADTATAISALTAASEANPANAVTFGAAGIAQFTAGAIRIAANIAQARKLLSDGGKYDGGFTGPGVGYKDESGYKVAGYVHENEWVAPKWMTESPLYADTINMLEYARRSKAGYADGGPVEAQQSSTSDSTTTASVPELTNAINTLNNILSGGIRSYSIIDQNNLLDIRDGINELNEINK